VFFSFHTIIDFGVFCIKHYNSWLGLKKGFSFISGVFNFVALIFGFVLIILFFCFTTILSSSTTTSSFGIVLLTSLTNTFSCFFHKYSSLANSSSLALAFGVLTKIFHNGSHFVLSLCIVL